MTNYLYIGAVKSGKTLACVHYLVDYLKNDYTIMSNIELTGVFKNKYVHISNSNFTNSCDIFEKHAVFIDEIGKTQYSKNYHSIKMELLMTQCRKEVGEDSDFLFTTQLANLQKYEFLCLMDYVIYPSVTMTLGELKRYAEKHYPNYVFPKLTGREAFKPTSIRLRIKKKTGKNKIFFKPFKTIKIEDDLLEVAEYYNTFEKVKAFGSGDYLALKDKYYKFIGTEGTKSKLKDALISQEHLGVEDAKRTANMIINDFSDEEPVLEP